MTATRKYVSRKRAETAEATQVRILAAARVLFARHGIDTVTVARIAQKARVATSTVLMDGVDDAARLVALTAQVARAIYESESNDLGLIRGASAFSPALRRIEAQFEDLRFQMQEERLKLLFAQRKAKHGLDLATARRLMWMYTSRDVYRMLVQQGHWTPAQYEAWLSSTLFEALVAPTR
jgi:AcrR family transcriptional regulator